jgi:hypothetical protein
MFSDEKFRLLAGTAMVAAAYTTWEDKVRTLGRSLASGVLASDDAEVDIEQLIMSAIADIEGPHLALLDLLVAWRPPMTADENVALRLNVPEYTKSMRADHLWDVGWRRWSLAEIRAHRPRLGPVFTGLIGTLQRHGLAVFQTNSDVAMQRLERAIEEDLDRIEQERLTGVPQRRSFMGLHVGPIAGVWEPTELGELVWLRFHAAGANVPDVWLTAAPASGHRRAASGSRARVAEPIPGRGADVGGPALAARPARPEDHPGDGLGGAPVAAG